MGLGRGRLRFSSSAQVAVKEHAPPADLLSTCLQRTSPIPCLARWCSRSCSRLALASLGNRGVTYTRRGALSIAPMFVLATVVRRQGVRDPVAFGWRRLLCAQVGQRDEGEQDIGVMVRGTSACFGMFAVVSAMRSRDR